MQSVWLPQKTEKGAKMRRPRRDETNKVVDSPNLKWNAPLSRSKHATLLSGSLQILERWVVNHLSAVCAGTIHEPPPVDITVSPEVALLQEAIGTMYQMPIENALFADSVPAQIYSGGYL
ncbi:hypothetical protein AAHC03_013290 [Spirometra sp. Aus1]